VEVIYGLLVLGVAFFAWRYFSPADVRLSRRFLARYLKDKAGRGPSKINIERLPVAVAPQQVEEQVYFAVSAFFPDGTAEQVLAQVFYPLESLLAERQKRHKASEGDNQNPMQASGGVEYDQAVPEQARRLKDDPLSDLREEARILEQKNARQAEEIKQLRALNSHSALFPRLLAHDAAQNITLLSSVGTVRLDKALQGHDEAHKEEMLRSLLVSLAQFHASSGSLTPELFAPARLTPALMRSQIAATFAGLMTAGVPLADSELLRLTQSAEPICLLGDIPAGPKLAEASPRAFFASAALDSKYSPVDFGRVRQDVSLLDVVELLCDPATGLTPSAERALMKDYLGARADFLGDEERKLQEQTLWKLSVYYRLLLCGYLSTQFLAKRRDGSQETARLLVPYWTKEALRPCLSALNSYLAEIPELAELQKLLAPKLAALPID